MILIHELKKMSRGCKHLQDKWPWLKGMCFFITQRNHWQTLFPLWRYLHTIFHERLFTVCGFRSILHGGVRLQTAAKGKGRSGFTNTYPLLNCKWWDTVIVIESEFCTHTETNRRTLLILVKTWKIQKQWAKFHLYITLLNRFRSLKKCLTNQQFHIKPVS